MTFKVKSNIANTQKMLGRLRSSLGDLTPAMQNASEELTKRMWYRFAFKRDPDNVPWKPWAASTKKYAKPGQKLMLNSRRLRDATRFIPAKDGIRVRLGTPYAKYHEQPTARAALKRVPRRAFIFSLEGGKRGLSKADEQYLRNAVRYQLQKARKK